MGINRKSKSEDRVIRALLSRQQAGELGRNVVEAKRRLFMVLLGN